MSGSDEPAPNTDAGGLRGAEVVVMSRGSMHDEESWCSVFIVMMAAVRLIRVRVNGSDKKVL